MGKVFDSTDKFSVFENKSRVYKNMNKDNYYLKNIQNKVDYEWKYRYNVVDIEEEIDNGSLNFHPLEAKIQKVYDEKMKTVLSDDWKKINFKDIQHPIKMGRRYKFSLNDNYEQKDIWLTLNTNTTDPIHGAVIRRCDSFLTILSNNGNVHYEPICLETDFKYTTIYYDLSISIAQGEIYGILQYNKYTKSLKINDRFFIGPVDTEDIYNNTIFKVKAIRKFQGENTFDENSIPLIYLALERDDVGSEDDLKNRIAKSNGIYREDVFNDNNKNEVIDNNEDLNNENLNNQENEILQDNFHLEILSEDGSNINDRIILNEEKKFLCYLYNNNEKLEVDINIECDLLSTDKDSYYYDLIVYNGNSFGILNKKMYLKDELKIRCFYNDKINDIFIEKEFLVSLGGLV